MMDGRTFFDRLAGQWDSMRSPNADKLTDMRLSC